MKLKEIKRELTRADGTLMVDSPTTVEDAIQNISVGLKAIILILSAIKLLTGPAFDKKIDNWIASLQIISGAAGLIDKIK